MKRREFIGAASACGRSRPWVSEIAPMVRIMPDQPTRGAACAGSPVHRRLRRNFLPSGLGAVGGLIVIAGAEGPKWGRSPVLDIGRREFIRLLGGAAIFVYLLSRTFFPMAVRTYSSC